MNPPVPAIVLAAQFVAALAFYPAIRWVGFLRRAVAALAIVVVMGAPLAIDADRRPMRLVAALWAAWMAAKLYDLYRGVRPNERMTFTSFVLYLVNPTWLVRRKRPSKRPWKEDAWRLGLRLISGSLALATWVVLFRFDWARWPFAVDHAMKAVVCMWLAIAITNAWAALWRLGGGTGVDVMARPMTAPTVAEFWRRWNRPAQSFFRTYVFDPAGGVHRPLRAMMATFAVSALGHEYILSIAVGRVQGYQTAFFLINGLAAVATLRVRPNGWRRAPWTIATLAFVLATGVLFGVSWNEVLPVYAVRD